MKITITVLHEHEIRDIIFDGDVTIYRIDTSKDTVKREPIRFCVDSNDLVNEMLDYFYYGGADLVVSFQGQRIPSKWDCSLVVFFQGERIVLDKFSSWATNGINNSVHIVRERPIFQPASCA